jgi:hypothetical protein
VQARGWTGLVVRRTLADRVLTASAFLVVLAAATTLVAAGVYPSAAARQGAVRALAAADSLEAAVAVTFDASPGDVAAVDAKVRGVLDAAMGPIAGTVLVAGRSESWSPANATEANPPLVAFGFLDGLSSHAHLVSGTWPSDGGTEIQAVVTQPAADRLGVATGGLLPVSSRLDPARRVAVRISGIVALDDRRDPAWGADPLALDGVATTGPFTTLGPLFVTRDSLLARTIVTRATLTWTAVPTFDGLATDEIPALAASTAAIHDRLTVSLGGDRSIDVRTGLPALLAGVGARVEQAGGGTAATAGLLLVLAVYALVLVAGLIVERRRGGSGLLVARGTGAGHLLRLAVIEAVILAVPAVLVGLPLGLGIVALLGPGGTIGRPAVLAGGGGTVAVVAAGTALIAIAGFVIPTLVSVGPIARFRRTLSRGRAGAAVTRGGIDIALLALAVLGLWQLRAGDPAGGAGRALGPLDVAAPAVALVAGAVLSLRITPAVARVIEASMARGPGATGALGGRSIGRRAATTARPVLLLVAAAGIALFCVEFRLTWEGSQADQVAQAVAGDVSGAVPAGAASGPWQAGPSYLAIRGVTAATPVVAETFDGGAGLRRGQLLAVAADPALAGPALRTGPATQPLAGLLGSLATARPTLPLPALPPGATRVRVTVGGSLGAVDGTTVDPAGRPGLTVTLVVAQPDGTLLRLGPATADAGSDGRSFTVPLSATAGGAASVAPAGPLTLVAVELEVRPVDGRPVVGSIGITGIGSTPAAAGDAAWSPLDLVATEGTWSFTRMSFGTGPQPVGAAPGTGATAVISTEAPVTGPGFTTLAFRPRALADLATTPIRAIVDQATLDAGRAAAGATVTIRTGATDTRRLVTSGPVVAFPGVNGPGIAVVDLGTWQLAQYGATGAVPPPTSWWLTTDGTDDAAVAAALATGRYPLADIRSLAAETRDRLDDPVAMAILGTLDLVAGGAIVFAVLGAVAASWTAGRSRRGELAVLVALGLSRRQLAGLIVADEAFPVATGIIGGSLLGLALGALVLPAITRAPDGSAPVPPAALVIPWAAVLALAAAGAVLVIVASLGHLRSIGRVPPAEALRRDAAGFEP